MGEGKGKLPCDPPAPRRLGPRVCRDVLTEILTNTAVAVILTPVAVKIGLAAGMEDPRALVMAVVFGASCCFANPLGYHTNLLVVGPGGYRFRDFLKVGLPLDLILCAVGVTIIPLFWPV